LDDVDVGRGGDNPGIRASQCRGGLEREEGSGMNMGSREGMAVGMMEEGMGGPCAGQMEREMSKPGRVGGVRLRKWIDE
jgi:hypothetical protein